MLALRLTKCPRLDILQVRYLLDTAGHVLNAWQSEIFTNVHENAHLNHSRVFDVCLEMSNDSKNQSRNLLITGKVNTGRPWRYTGGHFVKISDCWAFSTCPAVSSEQKFSKCRGDSELIVCPASDISLTSKPTQGPFSH